MCCKNGSPKRNHSSSITKNFNTIHSKTERKLPFKARKEKKRKTRSATVWKFLGSQVIDWVPITCLISRLSCLFATQERKQERGSAVLWLNLSHHYEFGLPKFFSKTFNFSIIFYSTWQISGLGQFRKACRSRKKESHQSEITWKQSEPVRSISEIEKRREFVRALWYEQCPKNAFKKLYTVKVKLVSVEKASISKEFQCEFHSGGEGNQPKTNQNLCDHTILTIKLRKKTVSYVLCNEFGNPVIK